MVTKRKNAPGAAAGNSGSFVRSVKWVFVVLVLIGASIFAAHHVIQFMGPKHRRGGELLSAGYYGQKIHVYCEGVTDIAPETPVFVFHHDSYATCINYARLQQGLTENGYASCCVERPGFGLSPLPQMMGQKPSLKGETALLVEAVMQKVSDEHINFVSVGHGTGGLYAWASNKLAPRLYRGLILLDGTTPSAFHSCPDVSRFFAKKKSAASSLPEQIFQQSGLRRLALWFGWGTIPGKPLEVDESLATLHRKLMLTDKMWFATQLASLQTKRIAEQLVGLSKDTETPAVFLVSNTGLSRDEGFPFMECFNLQGAKLVQKLFSKSLVIPVRSRGHLSLTVAVEELLRSARFVVSGGVEK